MRTWSQEPARRVEVLIAFVVTIVACAVISQLAADNSASDTATTIVQANRAACVRANENGPVTYGSRSNQRFLLKLVRDLASTSTAATRETLAGRAEQIKVRVSSSAPRPCVKDYPNP